METNDTPCSQTELMAALEGCILTDYLPLASSKVITISGFVSTVLYLMLVLSPTSSFMDFVVRILNHRISRRVKFLDNVN